MQGILIYSYEVKSGLLGKKIFLKKSHGETISLYNEL